MEQTNKQLEIYEQCSWIRKLVSILSDSHSKVLTKLHTLNLDFSYIEVQNFNK